MNSFARFMGMEDRVGTRRFCNERKLAPFDLHEDINAVTAFESFAMAAAFGANKLGLAGEKVLFASIVAQDGVAHLVLITRTRTQRFLARITRSL